MSDAAPGTSEITEHAAHAPRRTDRSRLLLLALSIGALVIVGALGGIAAFWPEDEPQGLVFIIPEGRAAELNIPTVDSAIEIPTDIRFGPNDVASITIINEDTTMNRAGPWVIEAGQTYRLHFDKPGTYKFDCTVDPSESVVITVTD